LKSHFGLDFGFEKDAIGIFNDFTPEFKNLIQGFRSRTNQPVDVEMPIRLSNKWNMGKNCHKLAVVRLYCQGRNQSIDGPFPD
jgi:hypothetical protein